MYYPSYQTYWRDIVLRFTKHGTIWAHRQNIGPVFPLFINADFQSYRGFKDFIERMGIGGLVYLDQRRQFPLGQELTKFVSGERKALPESRIKEFYQLKRGDLLVVQSHVSKFHHWFFENKQPSMSKEVQEVHRAMTLYLKSIHLEPYSPDISTRYLLKRETSQRYKTSFNWRLNIPTLPARCYMEMIDLIADDKKLSLCKNCHFPFITGRRGQFYCKRPVNIKNYSFTIKSDNIVEAYEELKAIQERFEQPKQTCNKIGPDIEHKKKGGKALKEKKSLLNKKYYYERTNQMERLRKVEIELKKMKKERSNPDQERGK